MLRAVKNDTAGKGYCGPTVVASITGEPLSKVLDTFREVRYGYGWRWRFQRRPRIKDTSSREVQAVLAKFGWMMCQTDPVNALKPPTLAQWLKARPPHWRN